VFGVVLCCVIRHAPGIASGQHEERPFPADVNEPIRLYTTGLGSCTRPISSPNPEAKAYFNQGFQLMYAFARAEAGRSFREAQRRDPNCAICYWGEAWAWGSYVNGRMTANRHRARTRRFKKPSRSAIVTRVQKKKRSFRR